MIRNFKSEMGELQCDKLISECLAELYEAEDRGLSDPGKVPTLIYYKNTIDKYYKEYETEED